MSFVKTYCDKWNINYSYYIEFGMNCFYISTAGLSRRQINLLKRYINKDGFSVVAIGFDRIYFDVSEGVEFSII